MYEEVDSNSLKVLSSNDTIEEIKNKIGIDINFPTNEFALGKKLDIIIKNENQEEKVVSIDNPYYLVGVTPENGYHFLRFCHKDKMPIHEYRIEENDLVYHYVYNYFAVGAFYDYGISPNEWGYNPGTGAWLGTEYTFNFTVESVTKLDEKYIPETISREGHTHSWNDLDDKPIEMERTLEIAWDGNLEETESVNDSFYYVSELTPTTEELTDAKIIIKKISYNDDGEEVNVTEELLGEPLSQENFNLYGYTTVIYQDNTEINGHVFSKKGTYFNYSCGKTGEVLTREIIPILLYKEEEKIQEKYIPNTIARTSDIVQPVQSDWLENDETSLKYIKNRTHYIGEGEYTIEGTFVKYGTMLSAIAYVDSKYTELQGNIPYIYPIEGTTATLRFNGTEYTDLEFKTDASGIYLGDVDQNLSTYGFRLAFTQDEYLSMYALHVPEKQELTDLTYSITYTGEKPVPLDEKYIPNTIARKSDMVQSDWNVNDETDLAFVKNKPFYTTDPQPIELCNGTYAFNNMGEEASGLDGYYASATTLFDEKLIADTKITIVYDNTEYNLIVCEDTIAGLYAGNGYILSQILSAYGAVVELEDTKEPFVVYDGGVFTTDTDASHMVVVTIYRTSDILIPDKYLGRSIWAGEGEKSIIVNNESNTASGEYSYAEGNKTNATKRASHAEGDSTTASGTASHAEGRNTVASDSYAHAEGNSTQANGFASHTEGQSTIATGTCQHVQGQYNIEDKENKYAHIVGNGGYIDSRSNAHTVDWNGNGWYAGSLYVGGTSQDDAEKVATINDIVNNKYNQIVMVDDENGFDYIIRMRGGQLISYCAATSIAITTLPSKTAYTVGETFDSTGIVVTATCQDGSEREVNNYTYSETALTVDDTAVEITYTENDKTFVTTVTITVTENTEITE